VTAVQTAMSRRKREPEAGRSRMGSRTGDAWWVVVADGMGELLLRAGSHN
jgi:hypothetical protein